MLPICIAIWIAKNTHAEKRCDEKIHWVIYVAAASVVCSCRKKKSPIKFATIVYKKHLQFATMTTHTRTHANINRRKKSAKAENSKNNQSLPLLFNLSTDDWAHHTIQQILPSRSNFLVFVKWKKYFLLQNSSKYCLVPFTWINFYFNLRAI